MNLPSKRIAYVILTWNSAAYINKCLDSIAFAHTTGEFIVYVVDNGSADDTVSIIKSWKHNHPNVDFELFQNEKNLGTTISRNIAIKKAVEQTAYICILDSDTEINRDAIGKMCHALDSDENIGIIGPVLTGRNGEIQNSGRGLPTLTLKLLKIMPLKSLRKRGEKMEIISKNDDLTDVGYLMSACWLIRSDVIRNIGMLDENIFYAPEDVEYCLRAWENNWRVVYMNNVQIYHAWQRLSRKKLFSKHNYEHVKGLLYLFWKYKFLFKAKYP